MICFKCRMKLCYSFSTNISALHNSDIREIREDLHLFPFNFLNAKIVFKMNSYIKISESKYRLILKM